MTLLNTAKLLLYWGWLELNIAVRRLKPRRARRATRRMALLSYCLPPQFNSGTHRPLSFIRYAQNHGWQIFPVTNAPKAAIHSGGLELQKLIPDGISVLEANNTFGDTSWQLTPTVDGGFAEALALVRSSLKALRECAPNVIVASNPPFCFAIAGMYLSRLTGARLVLDYRDEWTLCPFGFTSKTRWDGWFEKRCVRAADKIIYTTQSHLEAHQTHFDIDANKQALVFNGWDGDAQQTPGNGAHTSDSISISYVGKLSGHVELGPFIQALDQAMGQDELKATSLVVNFVGPKSAALLQELEQYRDRGDLKFTIAIADQVEKSKALEIMQASDFLLMLCKDELKTYIPGKLYDYLSQRKPVIAYGVAGEVTQILEQLDAGIHVEEGEFKALIGALVQPPDLNTNDALDRWLQSRTREHQAQKLYEVLDDLQ